MAKKNQKVVQATPEEANLLDQMVERFLLKNEQKKLLEAELAKEKEAIEDRIIYEKRMFVEGEIVLSTGKIKTVAAAPALVWAKSGKSLTPAERENLATLFPEQYRKLDINAKLVAEVFQNNHDVADALGRGGLEVKEGTNWQVKPLN
jgi:hypothetical protein